MSATSDISKFLATQQENQKKAIDAAIAAIDVFAEQLIGDAQQLCPVEFGTLKGSGIPLPTEVSSTRISKIVGFNTDYAAAVHENLTANHTQGQAKFLESAMRALEPKFGSFVADRVSAATSGGGSSGGGGGVAGGGAA